MVVNLLAGDKLPDDRPCAIFSSRLAAVWQAAACLMQMVVAMKSVDRPSIITILNGGVLEERLCCWLFVRGVVEGFHSGVGSSSVGSWSVSSSQLLLD